MLNDKRIVVKFTNANAPYSDDDVKAIRAEILALAMQKFGPAHGSIIDRRADNNHTACIYLSFFDANDAKNAIRDIEEKIQRKDSPYWLDAFVGHVQVCVLLCVALVCVLLCFVRVV